MRAADDPIDSDPQAPKRSQVELLRAAGSHYSQLREWHHTDASTHRAVLLGPTGAGAAGVRIGLEFRDRDGKLVMLFPGANDALIVTEE